MSSLCTCGCGQTTTIYGGRPRLYVHGHNARGQRLEDRFWAKVDKDGPIPTDRPELGPCWVWTGARTAAGYGEIWINAEQSMRYAHRISLLLDGREVDALLDTDHLCRNPPCVRPTHLEMVPHQVNNLRGLGAQRGSHCTRGHAFTDENTYILPSTGQQVCRTCRARRSREFRARHRITDAGKEVLV